MAATAATTAEAEAKFTATAARVVNEVASAATKVALEVTTTAIKAGHCCQGHGQGRGHDSQRSGRPRSRPGSQGRGQEAWPRRPAAPVRGKEL